MTIQETVNLQFKSRDILPNDGSSIKDEHFILFEVAEEIAALLEDPNEELIIKGAADEDAVLCTNNRTFQIRKAETSNMILIANGDAQETTNFEPSPAFFATVGAEPVSKTIEIIHSSFSYLEAVPKLPDLSKLLHQLVPFRGVGEDKRMDPMELKLNSTSELFDSIQASQNELLEFLKSIHAVELDGSWRIIDLQYLKSVLDLIFLTAVELDMSTDALILSAISDSLQDHEIPKNVLLHCLSTHSEDCQNIDDELVFCISNEMVSKTIGHALLARMESELDLNEFMLQWQNECPTNIAVDLNQLRGLFLLEVELSNSTIKYFPMYYLPRKPDLRFKELFSIRTKWKQDELLPYRT